MGNNRIREKGLNIHDEKGFHDVRLVHRLVQSIAISRFDFNNEKENKIDDGEIDWKLKTKNFLNYYHNETSIFIIKRFKKTMASEIKKLPPMEICEIFDSMIKEMVLQYTENYDNLIYAMLKIGEQINIFNPIDRIREYALGIIEKGLYGSIDKYREKIIQINNCSRDIKDTLRKLLKGEERTSIKMFKGALLLMTELYTKNDLYLTMDDIVNVGKILFKHHRSKDNYSRNDYLDLVTYFIHKTLRKLYKENENKKSSSLMKLLPEFNNHQYDWPDNLALNEKRQEILETFGIIGECIN